ncbi:hypothetical protein IQ06DRAFT_342355 [Phaeosphaeriaceae sp. SRC1lsM3a]|nr:hypothetical protein IQ06DRAFT_342355 [Stagonospora sp. SRC1lsM3a]
MPPTTHGHQETAGDSSTQVGDGDCSNGDSSPAPLPVIEDCGPPTAQNYEIPDVYWNRIMIEADEDQKVRMGAGPRRKGHSETRRSGLPDALTAESPQPRGSNHAYENRQRDVVNSSTTEASAAQQGRHTSGLTHLFQRRNNHGRGQTGHDLTVMSASVPTHNLLPTHQVQPPRPSDSLIPGTFAWDDFMNPLEYTPRSRLPNPGQLNVVFEESPRTHQSFNSIQEGKDLPDLPLEHYSLTPLSSQASRKTPPLTWNACLNEVIGHGSVDQDMVERVKEMVKSSTTTNGDGGIDQTHLSTIEVGLVPNFSYPIVGSPFYDRISAAQSPPPTLTNGVSQSPPAEVDTELDRHTSTVTNRSLDFDFDFHKTLSTPSSPLRSPTSSTSDSLYRPPTPSSTSTTRRRLDALLTEILTRSELDLCQTILRPPLHSPPRLDPLPTRLILSLHRALLHLQDRVLNSEDILLPQLGTALEKKTYTIDVLSVEVRNLDDQIPELKLALDFGNRIIAGCWVRDYEVWRTLLGIRERRRGRKEWWRGWKSKKVEDGVLSPDEAVEAGMTGEELRLRNGETEALINMTRQNLEILREDVDDMVEKVERCRKDYTPYPAVERVEGSWRDV